jgi:hypothetical protein
MLKFSFHLRLGLPSDYKPKIRHCYIKNPQQEPTLMQIVTYFSKIFPIPLATFLCSLFPRSLSSIPLYTRCISSVSVIHSSYCNILKLLVIFD